MGRAVGVGVERATDALVSPERPLPARLAARAALGGLGAGLEMLPGHEDTTLWRAGLRSGGELLWVGSVGGALFDVGTFLQHRYPAQRWVRPALIAAPGTGAGLLWGRRRMAARTAVIKRWPVEQRATVPAALGIGGAVYAVGVGLTRGDAISRNGLIRHLGPGFGKNARGRAGNAALWAAGAAWLYNAGVGYIGRANERVEPGYTAPPASTLVSGSPDSLSPFEDLAQQGRRYVTDVVTPQLIAQVLEEPAKATPIRVFVGYNSEPLYPAGRAELALEELERTGAFARAYLLLVSPTGTGWVDQTMIESAEFLARGDIATCAIQYGRFPSF